MCTRYTRKNLACTRDTPIKELGYAAHAQKIVGHVQSKKDCPHTHRMYPVGVHSGSSNLRSAKQHSDGVTVGGKGGGEERVSGGLCGRLQAASSRSQGRGIAGCVGRCQQCIKKE